MYVLQCLKKIAETLKTLLLRIAETLITLLLTIKDLLR